MKWNFYVPDFSGKHTLGRTQLMALVSFQQPAWAYFLDFVVYPLLIIYCGWEARQAGLGPSRIVALAAAGLIIWTFAEYILHRGLFHHFPIIRDGHFAHHHSPRELIGTPTIFSAIIFLVLVYVPLVMVLGRGTGSALSVGLLFGYLAYVGVHHLVHHASSHGIRHLARLKRHHALHHHGEMDCNFGVTTMVWDRLFGTLR